METKGGCCITRCQTPPAQHISKVHTIMLGFRPIAPKPLPAAALSDASSSETPADAFSRSAAAKRKRAKGNTNTNINTRRCTQRRNAPPPPPPPPSPLPPPTTLPLLLETPVLKKTTSRESHKNAPGWLSFGNRGGGTVSVDSLWLPVAGSVVTVECVTETWREEESPGLGSGDEERKAKLDEDVVFVRSEGYHFPHLNLDVGSLSTSVRTNNRRRMIISTSQKRAPMY